MVHCVVAGTVLAQRGRNPLLDEPSPPRRQSRPSLATVLEDPRLASLLLEDSRLSGLLEDSRLDAVNFEVRYCFPIVPGCSGSPHLSPQQSRVFQVPAVEIVCSACRSHTQHTPATLTAAQGRETSLLDELLAAGRPRGRGRAFADVMSLLRATPEFSVLAKALELTDLADSLEAGGPFTVFAPTNRAFDRVRGGRDKMLANVDRWAALAEVSTKFRGSFYNNIRSVFSLLKVPLTPLFTSNHAASA